MPRITRTTNPTSLKELNVNLFTVRVQSLADGKLSFWLERFDFSRSGLKANLRLDCIAHAGSTEEYFELGTVDAPVRLAKPIHELALDRPLKFRFLVYEEGNPRLVAFVDNVRAIDESGTLGESLIDIEAQDLGGISWKLEIPEVKRGIAKPVLLVEKVLFPTPQAAARDPWLGTLVMPEVMRQIADAISQNIDTLDDPEVWIHSWSEYLADLGVENLMEDSDEIARAQWVDAVVSAFCAKPQLKAHFNFALAELEGAKL